MIIKLPSPLCAPDTGGTPPAANVAVPREPSAVEMAVEFVDDLNEVKDEPTTIVEKTAPEPTKTEPKSDVEPGTKVVTFVAKDHKTEPKAEPTTAPIEPVKPVAVATKQEPVKVAPEIKPITPLTPSSATPKARDYSGFSAEEAAVLKQMSNEAFDYTSKVLKERKELEPLKNASFLQHPDAYQLDPSYKTIQEDVQYLTNEAQYWEAQLLAIAEGKPWAPITGWKNGQPVLGAEQQPTELAKIQVTKCMNQCAYSAQQSQQKLTQFTSTFQDRVRHETNSIQQECARRFSWVADPKILDATVNVEGVGDKSIKDIKNEFSNLFPPYLRNTIGVDVAGHMFVALQIYQQKVRELENGKHVAEVKKDEVLLAEPSTTNRPAPAGKAINGVTEFSLEGMPS